MAVRQTMSRLMTSAASEGASLAYRKLKIILWKGVKILSPWPLGIGFQNKSGQLPAQRLARLGDSESDMKKTSADILSNVIAKRKQ